MNNELKIVLETMTNSEIADYVLLKVCNSLAEIEVTDVLEITKHSLSFCDYLKREGNCSSTKIFKVFENVVKRLKKVAGDGGIVTITRCKDDVFTIK
ncbi:MAG: hypothetical protein ACREV6_19630 [Clostridium sp.]|uniref:hypothetical protein n=1 Tax=Clostridium sp. TaxID=1506 RepID=UPI003D6C9BE7